MLNLSESKSWRINASALSKVSNVLKALSPIFLDIRDNSGLRFLYTPNLRRYDAAIMDIGHRTSGFLLVVPPHLDAFEIEGGCSADCIGGVSWKAY